jgi:hypothetical protein
VLHLRPTPPPRASRWTVRPHLVQEARSLYDPQGLLETLKSAYAATQTYDGVRREVRGCAPLLDLAQSQFDENTEGLSSLASYLIRTYLYASAFDQGARSPGMGPVLDLLGQHRAGAILSDLRQRSFSAFVAARRLFEELSGAMWHRVEAFIVNASAHNELAVILGLRLLARGRPSLTMHLTTWSCSVGESCLHWKYSWRPRPIGRSPCKGRLSKS